MNVLSLIDTSKPAQPGTAEIMKGRVTKHVAICTHCGITETHFNTKLEAETVAVGHIHQEHPEDVPEGKSKQQEIKDFINGNQS